MHTPFWRKSRYFRALDKADLGGRCDGVGPVVGRSDLAQHAAIKVGRMRASRFNDTEHAVRVMWMALASEAIDQLRRQHARKRGGGQTHRAVDGQEPSRQVDPRRMAEIVEQRAAILAIWARFEAQRPNDWKVLRMIVEDRSTGDIATALGIPFETARKRCQRAMARLGKELTRSSSSDLVPAAPGERPD